MILRRVFAISAAALFAAGVSMGLAHSQTFPSRPITLIVPFAPGGPTDVVARIVGEGMGRLLGQPIIIENIGGAGGGIGALRGARAEPDGYTLTVGNLGTHGAAPGTTPNLPYDPDRDFAPIGLIAETPIILVTRPGFPAESLTDLVAHVKASGDKVSFGHAGVGATSHITCLLFNSASGAAPNSIAYRGTAPALNDLLGKQIDYMCDQSVILIPQIRGGAIKAYAIASPTRSPALPDVPTSREAGLPAFEVSAWNALFAPKSTPPAVLEQLNNALIATLADAGTRKRLEELGAQVLDGAQTTPAALSERVRYENDRWIKLLRSEKL